MILTSIGYVSAMWFSDAVIANARLITAFIG